MEQPFRKVVGRRTRNACCTLERERSFGEQPCFLQFAYYVHARRRSLRNLIQEINGQSGISSTSFPVLDRIAYAKWPP